MSLLWVVEKLIWQYGQWPLPDYCPNFQVFERQIAWRISTAKNRGFSLESRRLHQQNYLSMLPDKHAFHLNPASFPPILEEIGHFRQCLRCARFEVGLCRAF